MSEDTTEDNGSIELQFVYAEGNTGQLHQVLHGGPSGRVTLGFSADVNSNMSLIIGNIPYFDGDPDQQIAAANELLDVIRELINSAEVKDAILENLEDMEDDEDREDEEE